VRYAVQSASNGLVFVPSFMTVSSGFEVTLRLLPQQSEGLQCLYH
jgi:hypothetical protein